MYPFSSLRTASTRAFGDPPRTNPRTGYGDQPPSTRRSGPFAATTSSVWTDPGRSTTTTRPRFAAVRAATGWGGASQPSGAVHPPSAASTTAKASTPSRSPASTTVAPTGETSREWKATTSSRVIAATVSREPAVGRLDRSEASKKVAISSIAPRCAATERSCSISASRCFTCRVTSASGNDGSVRAWRRRSIAYSRCRLATSTSTLIPASDAPAPRATPLRSRRSANSLDEWFAVPSSRVRAMIVATPSVSRGSRDSGSGIETRTEWTY